MTLFLQSTWFSSLDCVSAPQLLELFTVAQPWSVSNATDLVPTAYTLTAPVYPFGDCGLAPVALPPSGGCCYHAANFSSMTELVHDPGHLSWAAPVSALSQLYCQAGPANRT
ncbi:hypothetical protein HDU91_002467, partial [Kappamyces sp. JEL0680]